MIYKNVSLSEIISPSLLTAVADQENKICYFLYLKRYDADSDIIIVVDSLFGNVLSDSRWKRKNGELITISVQIFEPRLILA